jgi:hypothetical protein
VSWPTEVSHEGFVHAEGEQLVDGRGRPLLMRGVGLGNWLLPEGYMWRFPAGVAQSASEIEALVVDLVGAENAAAFWRRFREAFIAEDDVAAIAAAGFDHVRLPLNARHLIGSDGQLMPEGLAPVDRLIAWCRRHGLWVILDLHAAPGGQTGSNIDDSPRGQPDLFVVGEPYRERTMALWTKLAARYRDQTVVAGYDLLNEPLPHDYGDRYAAELVILYRELTAAIRAVDRNHLLIYEGTRWATDWSIFTEAWDTNSMLQFHRYWTAPDRSSVEAFVERGRALSLPIYMGEGGENDQAWLQTAFGLYEDLGISWNHWPWKKLDTWNSPMSVTPPGGWNEVVDYAAGVGPRPPTTDARGTLDELLERVRFDACEPRPEVVRALFRRVPIRLVAEAFGYRGAGRSYRTRQARPLPWFRADDQVTLRCLEGTDPDPLFGPTDAPADSPAFEVVIDEGDWVEYAIESTAPERLSIELDPPAASAGDARLPDIVLDGEVLSRESEGPRPRWTTSGVVAAGRHAVRVEGRRPDTVIRSLSIEARP